MARANSFLLIWVRWTNRMSLQQTFPCSFSFSKSQSILTKHFKAALCPHGATGIDIKRKERSSTCLLVSDEVLPSSPICCLLSSLNSHGHWSWCYFCSYVLHLFFEQVLVAPCLPFMNPTGCPPVSASAMNSGFLAQPTSRCSNNTPSNPLSSWQCFTLLAGLGLRPTHVQWLPFPFFKYLNKEGNIESRWGATWKPGKFPRIIIHIPVSGCQR